MENIRRKAAELARQFYAGNISFSDFLKGTSVLEQDKLVEELVDLITHQPKRGGFYGASERKYKAYMENIFALIQRLEKG